MMQTEPEDPMPSPGESEDLPIALRKGFLVKGCLTQLKKPSNMRTGRQQ
ncbi:uncharacterized protein G2W53_033768 [Senna tora]|uniref:Uncharacterized protein n=1 Tax=Senna tora TaxID=362788 RepID=A0A834T2U6_9FABA|nr:uncharacterized protein G2W53_033768 [Senna tora]